MQAGNDEIEDMGISLKEEIRNMMDERERGRTMHKTKDQEKLMKMEEGNDESEKGRRKRRDKRVTRELETKRRHESSNKGQGWKETHEEKEETGN